MFGFHLPSIALGAVVAWNVIPQPLWVRNFYLRLAGYEKVVAVKASKALGLS